MYNKTYKIIDISLQIHSTFCMTCLLDCSSLLSMLSKLMCDVADDPRYIAEASFQLSLRMNAPDFAASPAQFGWPARDRHTVAIYLVSKLQTPSRLQGGDLESGGSRLVYTPRPSRHWRRNKSTPWGVFLTIR